MKSLLEYICETIGSKELDAGMDVSEISIEEFENILFEDVNFEGTGSYSPIFHEADVKRFRNWMGIVEGTTRFYKMSYSGVTLGIFSLFYLKDIAKLNKYSRRIFTELFYVIEDYENKNLYESKPLNLKTYTNAFDLSEEEKRRIMSRMEKSVYIPYLHISSKAKDTAGVSQIAVIKYFYGMLLDMLKKEGISTICAIGCDTEKSDKYVKLGGFINLTDFIKDKYRGNASGDKLNDLIYKASGFVYKRI